MLSQSIVGLVVGFVKSLDSMLLRSRTIIAGDPSPNAKNCSCCVSENQHSVLFGAEVFNGPWNAFVTVRQQTGQSKQQVVFCEALAHYARTRTL
jgi:hypothetical protein